ncbi:aspartic peptidase domain-containing protein [Collybia nuda]|uniref:Aspartic peptidase domain-containing protein n=1 Tax=Collybia nuda TaxID=64659 RepID=A0A9P6CGJ9_9AGAR|nr:aspartic peptidase domain-containing protein [Collybia nuda]
MIIKMNYQLESIQDPKVVAIRERGTASGMLFTCAFALPHTSIHPESSSTRGSSKQGLDIPIQRRVDAGRRSKRGDISGSVGVGNNADVLYTVPIELGSEVVAVNLDTGSSDLWVVSDACQTGTCQNSKVPRYPSSSIRPAGADVQMFYGDSTSGTFASGTIARDTATIAGVAMTDQAFGAINSTSNAIVQFNTAGIFGLGFPSGSKVQESLVTKQFGPIVDTDNFIQATYDNGPLLTRITMTEELEMPMFTITLQRSTIDIGGTGLLTIGKLPDGIDNSSLTWVPVRLYSVENGGLKAPTFAPDEVYPFRWEIDIDGVFLDGQKVPDSTIPASGVNPGRVSALIDTGNSILRGPEDMVNTILRTVSPTFDSTTANAKAVVPCAVPHTVAFQIGGKMFPVDPRDFIGELQDNDATNCVADNIVSTDPPRIGSLYSWSLGDPFLKSNLVAFHYGNLTHPSVDPPRIGFLSTVPANADDLLKQAVADAQNNGGNFEETLVVAPTASAAAAGQITVSGAKPTSTVTTTVPGASPSSDPNLNNGNKSNSALSTHLFDIWAYTIPLLTLLL